MAEGHAVLESVGAAPETPRQAVGASADGPGHHLSLASEAVAVARPGASRLRVGRLAQALAGEGSLGQREPGLGLLRDTGEGSGKGSKLTAN